MRGRSGCFPILLRFGTREGMIWGGLVEWLQLIIQMQALEKTVRQVYGERLVKCGSRGNPNFIFCLFEDTLSHEVYYFRAIELPTFLYISQATTQLIASKYDTLVPRFQITPVDRSFQAYTYLVRSPFNILPLSAFLQIKKDCGEPLDIDFFLHFLEFAKNSFRKVEAHSLPLFGLSQIGVTESGEFLLSDPAFYFSGHDGATIKEQFGSWIADFVREVLKLPLDEEEQEAILREYFGEYLNAIRPLFEYLMSGEATLDVTEGKLASAISRFSEEVSTVTSSFVDVNELIERSLNESLLHPKTKFDKIGRLAKAIILCEVLALIAGMGYFSFQFFTRSVQCLEGEYLNSNNQCNTCSFGCLRCSDAQPERCIKCELDMFLVLTDEEDREGSCLGECRGRVIKVGVCVVRKDLAGNEPAGSEMGVASA